MNLPPLMGRRDAAYDEAAKMLTDDFFSVGGESRRRSYRRIGALLRCAEEDTHAILALLSSPDTMVRERKLLAFFNMLAKTVTALEWFVELEATVFSDGDEQLRDFKAVQTGAELARGERMVAETWQVSGRSNIPFEQQVKLDTEYIQSQSFWKDCMILLKTIPAVLTGDGSV